MTRYFPVRLAHRVFEAVGGSDRKLPPVIFMHAMLCSKEVWDIIPQHVAERTKRKVYTYDARNHGESEHTRDYTFDQNLRDLYAFMDQMKIKNSVLVGHSMGGMTAISAALNEPKMVEKLFIVDMYVRKIERELIDESIRFMKTWTEVVRCLPKDTPPTELTRISVRLLYEKLPEDMRWKSEMEGYLLSRFLYIRKPDGGYDVSFNPEAVTEALLHYRDSQIICTEALRMLSDSPSLRNLTGNTSQEGLTEPRISHTGKYEGPAYFIYGAKSPFFVADEEEDIKKHFPNAEMIEFKGASHHLFADYPERFTDTLVQKMNQY